MDDATRKTLPFAAWWAAYTVIGGAIFVLSNLLLRLSALEGMTAVFLSVLLTVGLGWLAASCVQSAVARRVASPPSARNRVDKKRGWRHMSGRSRFRRTDHDLSGLCGGHTAVMGTDDGAQVARDEAAIEAVVGHRVAGPWPAAWGGMIVVNREPSDSPRLGNRDVTLRPSRRKWILMLVGCATFVALALWLVPSSDPAFWIAIVLFGPGAFLSLFKLFSPSEFLRLTANGYEEHVLFRSTRVAWEDVERFSPYRVGTTPMVGIKFSDSYAKHAKSRRLARSFAGMEGALSDTYGKPADELANLLNHWREANRPSAG